MKVFERKKDGSVKIPHTFVILFLILICSVILTWLIPSGAYTRITGANGVKIVQPDQFSYIAKSYVHLWQIPTLVVKGFSSQNVLIFSTLIAGGGFHVLLKTGAIHSLIWIVVKKFGNQEAIFIPLLMLICALIATTQSVTIFMAFTPILVMMAKAMGFDSLTGAAIPILGGAIGFSTGTLNPSSTIVAQTIAGLPPYSGIGYRFLSLFVFWFFTALFVVHYAKKIKAHPEQSPVYDLDQTSQEMPELNGSQEPLTLRKILCLLTLVVSLSILVYGCIYWKWETQHLSIAFIWMSIIVGCIAGFSPSTTALYFVDGCKEFLATAMIIGIAKGITFVFSNAHVMDTIVHSLSLIMTRIPLGARGIAMYWANLLINIPITSASGQAGAVMPIFAPLADMVGITRQTAVLAYHFGDGFCNYILPWSSALMGNLGVANIPYDRWMRFMWKIFLLWILVGSVLVFAAQMVHYGPF